MTDANFTLTADVDLDDLPRTLRREHEARARQRSSEPGTLANRLAHSDPFAPLTAGEDGPPATVTRIDVPFFHLVLFFLKAVIAAVPALILLGALLWLAGDLLQATFPELIKMNILISFPNG